MISEKIWSCKIGGLTDKFPSGCDLPMRVAIAKAFREVMGCEAEFLFSGWGSELTKGERAVVENNDFDAVMAESSPVNGKGDL